MAEKYTFEDTTKRTTPRILKEILKFKEKASGNTSNQQAFEILMTEWNLEAGIENIDKKTHAVIYKDGEIVHEFIWDIKRSYKDKDRDWNWDFIYRSILECIIKNKYYKRPKISKSELRRIEKEKAEAAKRAEKEAKLLAKQKKIEEAAQKPKSNGVDEVKPKRKRRTKTEMEALRNSQK